MPINESLLPSRRPSILDAVMPHRPDILFLKISTLFGGWKAGRISRWTGINQRTLQRWQGLGVEGRIPDDEWPEQVASEITAQLQIVEDIDMIKRMADQIKAFQNAGVHDEVIAAWLAHHYKQLVDREIE